LSRDLTQPTTKPPKHNYCFHKLELNAIETSGINQSGSS